MMSSWIFVKILQHMESGKDFSSRLIIKKCFLCHEGLHMDFSHLKTIRNFSTNAMMSMIQDLKDDSSGMMRHSPLIGKNILMTMGCRIWKSRKKIKKMPLFRSISLTQYLHGRTKSKKNPRCGWEWYACL